VAADARAFLDQIDFKPAVARSSEAWMPLIPPPTTITSPKSPRGIFGRGFSNLFVFHSLILFRSFGYVGYLNNFLDNFRDVLDLRDVFISPMVIRLSSKLVMQ
jgi:hypothetical protein